jgi:hypothetical protein
VSETSPFDVFHRLIRQALGESSAHDEPLDLQVFEAEDVPGAAVVKFFPEELAESLHAVYVPAGLDEDGSVMERLHEAVATHEGLVPVEDAARQRLMLTEVRGLLERYLEAADGDLADGAGNDALYELRDGTAGSDDPDAAARSGAAGEGGVGRDAAGADGDEDEDEDEADDGDDDGGPDEDDDGRPPARIEFGPLEALQALGAAKDGRIAGDVSGLPSAGERTFERPDGGVADDALPDDRPSFRALALDVLSGVPLPHGSAPDLVDSYEVWAYRHEPLATVVLRFFDGGRAVVLGAIAPDVETFDPGRFFAAAYQLLATKAPSAIEGATEGRLSDLEPLDVADGMARLGRALGLEHTADVHELTTDLLGEASPETLDASEEIRLLDPRAQSSAASLFAAIASDVVEVGGDVLWTRKKERSGEPRIEVLEHRDHPRALLLIDWGAADEPVEVAAYLPGAPREPSAFAADARKLLALRQVHSEDPQPLVDGGAFRRVPNSQAVFAVESALESLESGEGHAIAFRPPPQP